MIWGKKKIKKPLALNVDISFPSVLLIGNRIIMRPPALKNHDAWVQVRGQNKDFLEPFEPTWYEKWQEKETYIRRLQRQSQNWLLGRGCSFLIFKDNGNEDELIGGMNINNICRAAAQYASLGYWIDEAHQGQGYMSEALALTLKYAFEDLNLHRIHAACLLHNERSRKVLVHAGFKQEGEAKKYLQINGKWQDHILYGLCVGDWSVHQDV